MKKQLLVIEAQGATRQSLSLTCFTAAPPVLCKTPELRSLRILSILCLFLSLLFNFLKGEKDAVSLTPTCVPVPVTEPCVHFKSIPSFSLKSMSNRLSASDAGPWGALIREL